MENNHSQRLGRIVQPDLESGLGLFPRERRLCVLGQGNLLTWIEAFGINVCQQSAEFQELGSWSLSFYDGNTLLYTNLFSVSHNSNGLLGITSPTFNQLVDLDDQSQNYTATPPVAFQAGTSTGNIMSWSGTLNYETSGGYGITLGVLPSFASVNNETQYQTYQSVGGQVQTEASVTASDSSSVNDCVTFYIEGPAGGVPDANITSQLVSSAQSYPSSAYYPNTYYPQDGTATPDLMAQVAMAESSYRQFTSHQDQPPNADLWNLDATYGVVAKWPDESPTVNPGGVHRTNAGHDGRRPVLGPERLELAAECRRWRGTL